MHERDSGILRQLVRDYPSKVQAFFRKVHYGSGSWAAALTINGRKTFILSLNGRHWTIILHGTARPGDSVSLLIRQIVEEELVKMRKG